MNAASGEHLDYPVFIDGEKIGAAQQLRYDIERDLYRDRAGPRVAAATDHFVGEIVGTHERESTVSFTIDILIPPDRDISTLEVAVPDDGAWRVTEFVDVVVTERRVDTETITDGVATEIHTGHVRELGKDVEAPDRVTYGSSEQPGVRTTVHTDGDSDDVSTRSDDRDEPDWFDSDDGFSATKHEFGGEQ